MKSSASIGRFLRALLLVLLAFICSGNSFKQEMWFYDAEGNGLYFQSHVADTSDFSSFLPKVTRVCARGMWDLFIAVNFITFSGEQGSYSRSDVVCKDFTTAASVKSLRYEGANDTDTNALSLYDGTGGSSYTGKEIFVTARAHTGITNRILALAITGASDWMLFEGQDLDGKSACYKLPSWQYIGLTTPDSFNLATIGSVFKGCDLREIQNYKMLQASSIANSRFRSPI